MLPPPSAWPWVVTCLWASFPYILNVSSRDCCQNPSKIMTSQGSCENKMKSCIENAWQSTWQSSHTQQTVEASTIPTVSSLWRPAQEQMINCLTPKFPEAEYSSQWSLVLTFILSPGGPKDAVPSCLLGRPTMLQKTTARAKPWLCSVSSVSFTGFHVRYTWNEVCEARTRGKDSATTKIKQHSIQSMVKVSLLVPTISPHSAHLSPT
jgi:hypothetical protein